MARSATAACIALGRSRHQHRLVVHAAVRQSVGVCAAARSGTRRQLGVPAGRRLAARRAGTCATPTCCARRSKPARDGSRSSTSRRACRTGMRSMRRSRFAGCCGRSKGCRGCGCSFDPRPDYARAPAGNRRRRDRASRWSAGRRATVSLDQHARRRYVEEGAVVPDRSAGVLLAERRAGADQSIRDRRPRSRSNRPFAAGGCGRGPTRCRSLRRSRCCDRRCA